MIDEAANSLWYKWCEIKTNFQITIRIYVLHSCTCTCLFCGNILAMDYCVECGHEFGNRQLIRCDVCPCGVHRLCGTGKYIFYNILHRM